MEKLAIIGLGLMGVSIALNAKKAAFAETITGFDQNVNACNVAQSFHFFNSVSTHLETIVKDADFIVIAVPIKQTKLILQRLNTIVTQNTIITDVGSTKQSIVNDAKKYFASHLAQFVPGHPITGSERHGGEHAIENLFQKKKVILTPIEKTHPAAIAQVKEFWQQLGSNVEIMPTDKHDKILALTSHLPHLLAITFMNLNDKNSLNYVGGGFKSFTRIAKANPDVWLDIFFDNHEAIIERLANLRAQLDQVEFALTHADKNLMAQFIKKSNELLTS